jgi:glucose/arabinose dehydrogenase
LILAALVACAVAAAARAADPGVEMDYGPFLTGSLDRDKKVSERNSNQSTEQDGPGPNALAAKAINVRLGTGSDVAGVAFDTDLLRYAAGWTEGYLDLSKTHLTTPKGSTALTPKASFPQADVVFTTPAVMGWSSDLKFTDPRPRPFGPLPRSVGRYRGLYVHGEKVVLSYAIGDVDILEMPGFDRGWGDGSRFFLRTFHVPPTTQPLAVLLCEEEPGMQGHLQAGGAGRQREAVGTGQFVKEGRRWWLKLEPHEAARVFQAFVTWHGDAGSWVGRGFVGRVPDPKDLTQGGPARFPPVVTRGALGSGGGAYVVDTLTLPDANPWKSWIRPSGLDFFSDGRLAVCTLNGDVWVVSGVDEKLEKLSWRRYATGLYEPLGLRVVKDRVYVLGRDQITRLHDLNNDGEADFYENFNSDAPCSANYHGFAFDLDVDSKGNFYYARAGQRMHPTLPMHGALLRVSPDGSKCEPIAAGLRAANGLCVGPDDFITVADNQGNWTPSSRINVIRQGGFYGWMPHVLAAGGRPRDDYDPPLCWIPTTVDNSSGSQVWSDPKRFGPLSGRMFHTSYGHACLMLAMVQKVDDGLYQGGVIKMPFRFDSGVMRGRVNPKDGQLYLCGLRGWQTDGSRDGTLVRVRYTGKPLYKPTDFKAVKGGIELTFSQPLDPATAEDLGSYGVQQWNYKWGEQYGSPDYSVKEPAKQGRDEVEVESAKLLPDRRTVRLAIPDVKPVMQMQIEVDVDAADGTGIRDTMWVTINRVPG